MTNAATDVNTDITFPNQMDRLFRIQEHRIQFFVLIFVFGILLNFSSVVG